jgi:hypothetical protein
MAKKKTQNKPPETKRSLPYPVNGRELVEAAKNMGTLHIIRIGEPKKAGKNG